MVFAWPCIVGHVSQIKCSVSPCANLEFTTAFSENLAYLLMLLLQIQIDTCAGRKNWEELSDPMHLDQRAFLSATSVVCAASDSPDHELHEIVISIHIIQ